MGIINKIKDTLWGEPDNGTCENPTPAECTMDTAYKTRWIWYHTILGILLFMVNMLLLAILIVLAIKL